MAATEGSAAKITEQDVIVTNGIPLPHELCDELERTGRKLIPSIVEDCGDVDITFPTVTSNGDKVRIEVAKNDVKNAKQPLLALSIEKLQSSFSPAVRNETQLQNVLIEKNKEVIAESTKGQISVPIDEDENKPVATISKEQNAVDKARALLESVIKRNNNITRHEISIEKKHHQHFLKCEGEVLRQVIKNCGRVQITFPPAGVNSNSIVIGGQPECVKAAKECMLEIVKNLVESEVTLECETPSKHRQFIRGPTNKCTKLKTINARFNVKTYHLNRSLPEELQRSDEQENSGESDAVKTGCDIIQIVGQPNDAKAARLAILDLVPITVKVHVPNYLHPVIIGPGGSGVRDFVKKYGVHLQLSQVYPKTDCVMIIGPQSRVEVARETIIKMSKKFELEYFAIQIRVDQEYHPKIIGPSGTVANKIMYDNDVVISFPPIGDPEGNIVTISGSQRNVRNAQDALTKIIEELGENNTTESNPVPGMQLVQIINPSEIYIPSDDEDNIVFQDTTKEVEDLPKEMQKIYETIKLSWNAMSSTENNAAALTDIREQLIQLYNNVIFKMETRTKNLQDDLNDQVSINKELKNGRVKLILEINDELEKCQNEIHQNRQQYDEKTAIMSETINKIEANLKRERKEKSKLKAENNKSLKIFKQLQSEHETLRATSIEDKKQIETLKSSIEELNSKEASLINELTRLNTSSNENFNRLEEDKLKLENEKNLQRFEELQSQHDGELEKLNERWINRLNFEHKALQATSSEYEKQMECLKSSIQELKEREASLNNALHGIRSTDYENNQLSHYRNQLQEMTTKHTKTIAKLNEVDSRYRKLLNSEAGNIREIDRLKTVSRDKDNKIEKLETDLKKASTWSEILSYNLHGLKLFYNLKDYMLIFLLIVDFYFCNFSLTGFLSRVWGFVIYFIMFKDCYREVPLPSFE